MPYAKLDALWRDYSQFLHALTVAAGLAKAFVPLQKEITRILASSLNAKLVAKPYKLHGKRLCALLGDYQKSIKSLDNYSFAVAFNALNTEISWILAEAELAKSARPPKITFSLQDEKGVEFERFELDGNTSARMRVACSRLNCGPEGIIHAAIQSQQAKLGAL